MTTKDSGSTRLTRRLDLLWGARQRPRRGPKPALAVEQIVSVAIEIADRDGLGALTMRRVAEQLGVTTMALYRYVRGKDELLDLIHNAAIGPPPRPDELTGDWRTALERWARADFALFPRHPWLLELIARTPQGPNWFAWLESALRVLTPIGLSASEMMGIVALLDGYVRGAAQVSVALTRATQRGPTAVEWGAEFAGALKRVIGDERYPALSAIAAAGGFVRRPERDEDASNYHLDFALQRALDGIESYVRARGAATRRQAARPRKRLAKGRSRPRRRPGGR